MKVTGLDLVRIGAGEFVATDLGREAGPRVWRAEVVGEEESDEGFGDAGNTGLGVQKRAKRSERQIWERVEGFGECKGEGDGIETGLGDEEMEAMSFE